MVRSVESVALDILRSIEDRLITDGVTPLVATTAVEVALYILNQKRAHLNDIQQRYQTPIVVTADEDMHISQFVIERAAEGEIANGGGVVVHMDWAHHTDAPAASAPAPETDQSRPRSRRRRRGRRDGSAEAVRFSREHEPETEHEEKEERAAERSAAGPRSSEAKDEETGAQGRKGPRRRGRRGGRRGRSGSRPQPTAGEEGRFEAETNAETTRDAESESRQNGAGRQPRAEQRPVQEGAEERHRGAERVLESVVTASEPPAKPGEALADVEAEPETPRRKGWWSRG